MTGLIVLVWLVAASIAVLLMAIAVNQGTRQLRDDVRLIRLLLEELHPDIAADDADVLTPPRRSRRPR